MARGSMVGSEIDFSPRTGLRWKKKNCVSLESLPRIDHELTDEIATSELSDGAESESEILLKSARGQQYGRESVIVWKTQLAGENGNLPKDVDDKQCSWETAVALRI